MKKNARLKRKASGLTAQHHNLLFIGVAVSSLIYIGWRLIFTIPYRFGILSTILGLALALAEASAVIESLYHHRSMCATIIPELPEIPDSMYPDVDILIATHSEDVPLLYKTINGCNHLKYPDTDKIHIYLCDDSDRPEMRELAEKMGIGYFGLSGNREAKAGNLNNALAKTNSPLVVTLDSDMIPTSEFLMETVPYFSLPKMIKENDGSWRQRRPEEIDKDEKIGFIQTPQSFYNADMFQFNFFAENNVPNEQDYFFREINIGRNMSNSVVYAGSNTVICREALEEVGGIQVGTITEDFATGMNIQSNGYTCYAIDKSLAHGLAPGDFKSLIKQRQRWGRGCVQTLWSTKFLFGPLPFKTKASYFVCFLYWLSFSRRLVYIFSPILFAIFGIVSVDCSLWELLLIWLPSYIIYNRALRVMSGNIRNQRWSNIIDTIMFPYLILPVFAEILGIRMHKFSVTPKIKSSSRNSEWIYAAPHIMLSLLSLVGLFYCARDMIVMHTYGGAIILYWLIINLYNLIMSIIFLSGRINYREDERFFTKVAVTLDMGEWELQGMTSDISENGMAVVLDSPEFIPYDINLPITLTDRDYVAKVEVVVVHVQQVGDKWKYSLKIKNCTEENRREYMQIVYDRSHTLAKSIRSDLIKDTISPIKGASTQNIRSNRKLPRVPMNQIVHTLDNRNVTLLNYNYEYILVAAEDALAEEMTIALDKDIFLNCTKTGHKGIEGVLYKVEGWREISAQRQFRKSFLKLLGLSEDTCGYVLKYEEDRSIEYA